MKNPAEFDPHLMTNRTGSSRAGRRLACSRCGGEFSCNPAGACWCKDEAFRLPMPAGGEDCLCPDCLRRAAKIQDSRKV